MNASHSMLKGLKARPKTESAEDIRRVEDIGETRGFTDRTVRRKPGRKRGPRTYQLHPKIMPETGQAIAQEAERLGLSQGQLIERLWDLYITDHR